MGQRTAFLIKRIYWNGKVNVRLYDELGQYTGTLEIIVDNIDKEKPNEFNLTATVYMML